MNGALAGARRTLVWGFLTKCAIAYAPGVVDGVEVVSALPMLPSFPRALRENDRGALASPCRGF